MNTGAETGTSRKMRERAGGRRRERERVDGRMSKPGNGHAFWSAHRIENFFHSRARCKISLLRRKMHLSKLDRFGSAERDVSPATGRSSFLKWSWLRRYCFVCAQLSGQSGILFEPKVASLQISFFGGKFSKKKCYFVSLENVAMIYAFQTVKVVNLCQKFP